MPYLNVKEIQAKTCIAFEKNEWVKKITAQVIKAAEAGQVSVNISLKGTPAEPEDAEEFQMLRTFFIMRGFAVRIGDDNEIEVCWDPEYKELIQPDIRVADAIIVLAQVLCNMGEALTTNDEDAKKACVEELKAIEKWLPETMYLP